MEKQDRNIFKPEIQGTFTNRLVDQLLHLIKPETRKLKGQEEFLKGLLRQFGGIEDFLASHSKTEIYQKPYIEDAEKIIDEFRKLGEHAVAADLENLIKPYKPHKKTSD